MYTCKRPGELFMHICMYIYVHFSYTSTLTKNQNWHGIFLKTKFKQTFIDIICRHSHSLIVSARPPTRCTWWRSTSTAAGRSPSGSSSEQPPTPSRTSLKHRSVRDYFITTRAIYDSLYDSLSPSLLLFSSISLSPNYTHYFLSIPLLPPLPLFSPPQIMLIMHMGFMLGIME